MELQDIKELIMTFKDSDMTKLNLKYEGAELLLEKGSTAYQEPCDLKQIAPLAVKPQIQEERLVQPVKQSTQGVHEQEMVSEKVIMAPMVGSFYASSAPDEKPFVTVGSKVKKGDVVCIIEAMKLMNEVEADQDGEIVQILIEDEAMVEYGQPLFIVK
ncbi:MAG: acetyl-CoA carboxylase biotin carboxyl carrier protein [Cellulosilyticaceae bacterium]